MRKRFNNYLGRNFKRKRNKDKLATIKRSLLMGKIHSKNTKFEQDFLLLLKVNSVKNFESYANDLKGKPDLIFRKEKICVFLDSDFWHGWQYPRWRHLLKDSFWREKIEANRKRDIRVTRNLRKNHWQVLRLWEHSIQKDSVGAVERIKKAITNSQKLRT